MEFMPIPEHYYMPIRNENGEYVFVKTQFDETLPTLVRELKKYAAHDIQCRGLYAEMGSGDTTCTCGYKTLITKLSKYV